MPAVRRDRLERVQSVLVPEIRVAARHPVPERRRSARRRTQLGAVDAIRLRRGRAEVEPDAAGVEPEQRLAEDPGHGHDGGRGRAQPQRLVAVRDLCVDAGHGLRDARGEVRRDGKCAADVRRGDAGGDRRDADDAEDEREPHVGGTLLAAETRQRLRPLRGFGGGWLGGAAVLCRSRCARIAALISSRCDCSSAIAAWYGAGA